MDNDLSEKLGALLSDPGALAKMASLAGNLGAFAPQKPQEAPSACADCAAKELFPVSGEKCPFPGAHGTNETSKNIANIRALLCALKPYLENERCERIDKILGMMKIIEIMGYMK